MCKLSFNDKLHIIHEVFIKKLPYEEVARNFRVAKKTISYLFMKFKKVPNFMNDLREKSRLDERIVAKTCEVTKKLLSENNVIDRAADVKVLVEK